MAMSVQNGERPRWAWSGQHVEVVSGWEVVATARPAWSWGSPVA